MQCVDIELVKIKQTLLNIVVDAYLHVELETNSWALFSVTLIKNSAEIFALLSFCGSCHESSNFQIKLTAILSMLFGHKYNFEIYAAEAFITYQ